MKKSKKRGHLLFYSKNIREIRLMTKQKYLGGKWKFVPKKGHSEIWSEKNYFHPPNSVPMLCC